MLWTPTIVLYRGCGVLLLVLIKSYLPGYRITIPTGAAPCGNMFLGICGQWRQRSACESTQSDQGLHYMLTESIDTIECINGELMCGCSKELLHLAQPKFFFFF